MVRSERAFAVLISLLVMVMALDALQFNEVARRMPLVCAAFTLIALFGYFAHDLRKGGSEKHSEPSVHPTDPGMLGWIVLMLGLIYFLGILTGLGAFVALYDWLQSKGKWYASILFGTLVSLTLWLVFRVWLGEVLYAGVLWPLVR